MQADMPTNLKRWPLLKKDEKEEETELEKMALVCRRVPANKPETVHEMLQHYWFIHLGSSYGAKPMGFFQSRKT